MNRAEKETFVADIKERFNNAPLVILTDFKGSTVDEMDVLRRACEPAGVHFQVVKNTLCKRALAESDKEDLTKFFSGNIGVIFAGEDPIAAAKLFTEQAKQNEKLEIRAGYFEGDVLDAQGVAAVAALPSREELLSILLRTMLAAPRQVMGIIRAPARDLLYLLSNFASKLEDQD
ncbi:MAG: 50S ribosomal protein L10 [Rhodobacterales bacterium]|nr:50S ribosomal protein L10 [Rhodobacterales bacterium]